MGKSNRAELAARAAEMRASQARKERQQKQMIAAAVAVVVVIIAVAVGVVVANNTSDGGGQAAASDTAFVPKLTSIPAAAFDAAGAPAEANAVPQKVQGGEVLMEDGKPRMIYVGAEFCPYCASERWAMVAALSASSSSDAVDAVCAARARTGDAGVSPCWATCANSCAISASPTGVPGRYSPGANAMSLPTGVCLSGGTIRRRS